MYWKQQEVVESQKHADQQPNDSSWDTSVFADGAQRYTQRRQHCRLMCKEGTVRKIMEALSQNLLLQEKVYITSNTVETKTIYD